MATFFRIPIVRFRTREQTGNARGEDEARPCTSQIGPWNLRRTWHHKRKMRIAADSELQLEQK
jgi:hypothetical protein